MGCASWRRGSIFSCYKRSPAQQQLYPRTLRISNFSCATDLSRSSDVQPSGMVFFWSFLKGLQHRRVSATVLSLITAHLPALLERWTPARLLLWWAADLVVLRGEGERHRAANTLF